MNLIGLVKCLFAGHDINPDESILGTVMIDKRNWLCKCHRCGLYEMRDGAISGLHMTLTEPQALRTKMEFLRDMEEFQRRICEQQEVEI